MNPSEPFTAAQRVFGIAELLESILKYLSLGDTLCNAQAVAKCWKSCIDGSSAIKKALLLATNVIVDADADPRLYMKPVHIEDFLSWQHRRRIARYIGQIPPTLSNIRRYAIQDCHENFNDYMAALAIVYGYLGEDRARFSENAGSNDLDMRACQLCSSVVHPFIRLGLWAQDGCFWTGYGSHAVLYIQDTPYPRAFRFTTISNIVLRMLDMVQDCPTASWIGSSIANPAFTTVSLSARMPIVRSLAHIKCAKTIHRETGVTNGDLLILIATVAIKALQDYEHAKICGIWGGLVDGGLENENAQKAEKKISEIREKTQPGLIAAKELKSILGGPDLGSGDGNGDPCC